MMGNGLQADVQLGLKRLLNELFFAIFREPGVPWCEISTCGPFGPRPALTDSNADYEFYSSHTVGGEAGRD